MLSRNTLQLAALSLCLLFQHTYAVAADARGQIVKSSGEVYVLDQQGKQRKLDQSRQVVHELDTIVTRDGARAVVQFNDGALSVLDENSRLRVEKTNWLSYIGGKIYFTFRKVFDQPKRVKTPFSTIGIRGTTFIIYDDAAGSGLALQEGEIDVESPGEKYELHKAAELDEYAAYKKQAEQASQAMHREFDDYKKEINKEFVEYRKSFTLEANRVIRFTGNRVDESRLDAADNSAINADFGHFETEAGELLQQFRAQAKQHREQMQEQELLKKKQETKSFFDDF